MKFLFHLTLDVAVVLLSTGIFSNVSLAQQAPQMSLIQGDGQKNSFADYSKNLKNAYIDHLSFKTFEALAGGISICQSDEECLNGVKLFKSFLCASDVCNGADQGKEPTACFVGKFDSLSLDDRKKASDLICSWIKSPNPQNRQELTSIFHVKEKETVVEAEAYILALKGSTSSCENYIKSYIGPYGPKWNTDWYGALAKCRILGHERTRSQEEKDFMTWYGAVKGLNLCSDIVNPEMRNACSAKDAASPIPDQYAG